ncbi:hypothetical protein [Flammeovirga sp. OC4]|uniref:DUF6985 domain-containing protein n=1 Tax=Flammeovirga sp. OC4 TaxID=1382345 RepID=UPI0005C790F5|nr:hypothetical protein [Flammeovirga sp. OC4]
MELLKEIRINETGIDGKVWVPFLEKYIDISMEKATVVNEYHQKIINSLQTFPQNLQILIQESLFKMCEGYKHACGLLNPQVENEADIWKEVNVFEIRLEKEFNKEYYPYFVMGVSGSWDDESMIEVVIEDFSKLIYVGKFLCYPAISYSKITANQGNYALR